MRKKILIISGDPLSINSEILIKSWRQLSSSIRKKIYLISNFSLLKQQLEKLGYPSNSIRKVDSIDDNVESNVMKVIDIKIKFNDPFKVSKEASTKFISNSFKLAHKLALRKDVMGIINCPINKKLLRKNLGVTELLASKCKVKNNSEVMLIRNKSFSVTPITTHIDIKSVSSKITINRIINKSITINSWYKKIFKRKPFIGILGLNHHNAELRKDSEEMRVIIPAIKKLKKMNFKIFGPLVADTIFMRDYKKYDVVVGMYHDQVLAPFKTIFKFDAINITLGLKYLRISPDHGTAINLIGKNKANAGSLLNSIRFINKYGL